MFRSDSFISLPLTVFFAVSFLLMYILPNHYFPWVVAYQEFLSFFCVIMLLCLLFCRKRVYFVSAPVVFLLFFACVAILQLYSGVIYFSGDGWIASAYLVSFAAVFFVGYNFGREPELCVFLIKLLAVIFILAGVLSVWVALRQWLYMSSGIWTIDLPPGARPFANMAQPNNLATLLSVSLGAVLYCYEKKLLGRLGASTLAVFLIFGVALAQSRTPWVASFCFLFFWVFKTSKCCFRVNWRWALFWVGAYWLSVCFLPLVADLLYLPSSNAFARFASLERWAIWMQLWKAVCVGPLWGYGWNQVSVAQVAVSLAYPVPIMVEHSHNILLDLLIWNGPLLGGVGICAITAWLTHLGWRARSVESVFCLIAVGFVLVHGILEFPLEYGFFLFPVGLLLGVVAGEQCSWREWAVPRRLLGVVLILAMGVFAWVWHEYRLIEEDFRLMRFETVRIGELKAEQAAPDVFLLTQLRELVRFARTPAHEGMSDEQLDWMRKVAHRYPYPPSLFRYSLALALNGRSEYSGEQLMILRSLHGEKHFEEGVGVLKQMQAKNPQLQDTLQLLSR